MGEGVGGVDQILLFNGWHRAGKFGIYIFTVECVLHGPCCSVLQCVAVCCSVLQSVRGSGCVAVGALQWVRCSECVAVCCNVLQWVWCISYARCLYLRRRIFTPWHLLECVAVRCSVLQCVAVSYSALQYVAVCSRVMHCVAVRCIQ